MSAEWMMDWYNLMYIVSYLFLQYSTSVCISKCVPGSKDYNTSSLHLYVCDSLFGLTWMSYVIYLVSFPPFFYFFECVSIDVADTALEHQIKDLLLIYVSQSLKEY